MPMVSLPLVQRYSRTIFNDLIYMWKHWKESMLSEKVKVASYFYLDTVLIKRLRHQEKSSSENERTGGRSMVGVRNTSFPDCECPVRLKVY